MDGIESDTSCIKLKLHKAQKEYCTQVQCLATFYLLENIQRGYCFHHSAAGNYFTIWVFREG